MIIYQLHETFGEYEDYMDSIVGSYIRRERAEEEMTKHQKELVAKNSRIRHCMNCPHLDSWYKEDVDNKNLITKMTEYCEHSEIVVDEDGYVICNAYEGCVFHDEEFYIETVEVEE